MFTRAKNYCRFGSDERLSKSCGVRAAAYNGFLTSRTIATVASSVFIYIYIYMHAPSPGIVKINYRTERWGGQVLESLTSGLFSTEGVVPGLCSCELRLPSATSDENCALFDLRPRDFSLN